MNLVIAPDDFLFNEVGFRTTGPSMMTLVWGGPFGTIRFVNPKEFPLIDASINEMATLPAEYFTRLSPEVMFLDEVPGVERITKQPVTK